MKQHQELLRAAADGLVPSDRFRTLISARRQRVEAKSGVAAYNLIHLRVEKDWFALCKWWQKPELGRDNCMNNTDTVGEQLELQGFQTRVRGHSDCLLCIGCQRQLAAALVAHPQVPVVVVTSFPDAVPEALETALASIKASSYNAVLGSELVQPGEELTREESALVRQWSGRVIGLGLGAAPSMLRSVVAGAGGLLPRPGGQQVHRQLGVHLHRLSHPRAPVAGQVGQHDRLQVPHGGRPVARTRPALAPAPGAGSRPTTTAAQFR